jgi:hypothetical protein
MKRSLEPLATPCHGDDRPDGPILDDLAGQAAPAHGHAPDTRFR